MAEDDHKGSGSRFRFPKLKDSENYLPWSISMQHALLYDDLWKAVRPEEVTGIQGGQQTGSSITSQTEAGNNATSTTSSPTSASIVERKAYSSIMLCLEDGPLLLVHNTCQTARQTWDRLKETYEPKGFATNFHYIQEFLKARPDQYPSLEKYLVRIRSIVDQLTGNGVVIPDTVVMAYILYHLPASYSGYVSTTTQALRKDKDAYNLVSLTTSLMDEARYKEKDHKPAKPQENLLNTQNNSSERGQKKYCSNCKKKGHHKSDCAHLYPDKAPSWWKFPSTSSNTAGNKVVKPTRTLPTRPKPNVAKPVSNRDKRERRILALQAAVARLEDEAAVSDAGRESTPLIGLAQTMGDYNIHQDSLIDDMEGVEVNKAPINTSYGLYINNSTDCLVSDLLFSLETDIQSLPSYVVNKTVLTAFPSSKNNKFIIDSGATVNTICNKDWFTIYQEINTTVKWGEASTILVVGKGTIHIQYIDTGIIETYKDVYYIPQLQVNLLSVSRMENRITTFDTTGKTVIIRDKSSNRLITKGRMEFDKLFYLDIRPIKNNNNKSNRNKIFRSTNNVLSTNLSTRKRDLYKNKVQKKELASIRSNPDKYNIPNIEGIPEYYNQLIKLVYWHKRLGHIGLTPLLRVLKNYDMLIENKIILYYRFCFNCEYCLKAKSIKNINKHSITDIIQTKPTFKVLDRIHSDICGKIKPQTYDSKEYFITYLCKASRFLDLYLLRLKEEALKITEVYINKENNNNLGRKIKEFFTDNGKEYTSKEFTELLHKNSIERKLSPSYTKEPNGFIERINRTIVNKIRAMLYNSNAPLYLWGEAAISAKHLYNITPHSSLDFKTPWEIKYNKKPFIGHIVTWGSICYYNDNKKHNKVVERNRKGIIIGYSPEGHKIYKVFDLITRNTL
jgi:hypothetical protein